MKLYVSGSLAYDRIMTFPGLFSEHVMPEKIHSLSVSFLVDSVRETFGGTAGNIAYNLGLLGEQPTLMGTVGADFEKYNIHLRTLGVDTSALHTKTGEPTSAAYVITDKADNQIAAFHPGAGGSPYTEAVPTDSNALVMVGPSNPTNLTELPKKLRAAGVRYLFDPSQQITALGGDALREGIEGAAALFGNDYEMALMQQKTGWSKEEMLAQVPTIVTTLGNKGSIITTREKEYTIAPVTARSVVDPTGAGDAYRAGCMKGMALGLPWQEVGQLASTVAVYPVEHKGTQEHSFTLEDIKARYQEAYGQELAL